MVGDEKMSDKISRIRVIINGEVIIDTDKVIEGDEEE